MRETMVLGAGLQGVCVALALAETGHRVTVIEREPDCLLRASLRNEGKIHLGFVYANDRGGRTPALMLEGALAFGPLLERWLGAPIPWHAFTAVPFTYAILRDSLVPADSLYSAWTTLQHDYEKRQTSDFSYLGTRPNRLWSRIDDDDPVIRLFGDRVAGAVRSAELAIDMPAFRAFLTERLRHQPNIRWRFSHHVREAARVAGGFRIAGTRMDGAHWSERTETVVNCLWEGRLAIDAQLGVLPSRPWVHRLKCRLLGKLPPRLRSLPSLTLMCGRFGDIVNYGDGRMYLSWYPACLRGWSSEVDVPARWDPIMRGDLDPADARSIIDESLQGLETVVPGMTECSVDSVAAGVIFSWGRTDIDDPASELHRRDEIGPSMHDGYVTVNTGKITTAPLFAQRVADLLTAREPALTARLPLQ